MISVVRLWETLVQSAKSGTSGYTTQDEFNRDLASVQTSLTGLLSPMYAVNSYVQELLAPFVKSDAISVTKPVDCFYFLGGTINGVPAYPILPTQDSLYMSSPIRRPSADNQTAFFYLVNNNVQWRYHGSLVGHMEWIRTPAEASIVLTPVSDADRDYLTPTAGADLEWPESAFNFILAMMMQKLGLELKDDQLIAFADLGINFENQKNTA